MFFFTICNFPNKYLKKILPILILSSFLSSCIATKKVAFVDNKESQSGKYSTGEWNYKVKPGDRFYINITDPISSISLGGSNIGNSTLRGAQGNVVTQQPTINDYVIQRDGTIILPVLGSVKVEGVKLIDLSNYLIKECEGYISNPSIKVFMTNYNVTVLGEVRVPGFLSNYNQPT